MNNTLFGLAVLMVLFSSINTFAESKIYHWVDAHGQTHYADRAAPGTEEIQVSPNNVVTTDNIQPATLHSAQREAVKSSVIEYQATIISPAHDSPLRSNDGTIKIAVKIIPEKQNTQKLQLFLDGKPFGSPQISSTIRVLNIDRGTHQIQVQLLDAQGNVVALTQVITVHLQRASIRSAS